MVGESTDYAFEIDNPLIGRAYTGVNDKKKKRKVAPRKFSPLEVVLPFYIEGGKHDYKTKRMP